MAADTLLAERPQLRSLRPASGAGPAPLIELQHVSKSYIGPEGPPVTILDDISLEVREGEMLASAGAVRVRQVDYPAPDGRADRADAGRGARSWRAG